MDVQYLYVFIDLLLPLERKAAVNLCFICNWPDIPSLLKIALHT